MQQADPSLSLGQRHRGDLAGAFGTYGQNPIKLGRLVEQFQGA